MGDVSNNVVLVIDRAKKLVYDIGVTDMSTRYVLNVSYDRRFGGFFLPKIYKFAKRG